MKIYVIVYFGYGYLVEWLMHRNEKRLFGPFIERTISLPPAFGLLDDGILPTWLYRSNLEKEEHV